MRRSPTRRIRLTRRAIEEFIAPAKGRAYIFDDKVPALSVCVTETGQKTYYVRAKIDGRSERMRLGRVESMTVDDARSAAQDRLGKVAIGQNPAAISRQRRAGPTLESAYLQFLKAAHDRGTQGSLRRE